MKNFFISLLLFLSLSFVCLGNAWGHAAIVWAYVENNMVFVEAFYPSGSKIQNAKVRVVDGQGATVVEGKTDSEGKYSYAPASKQKQTVVVIAGESHVGDFELTEEDLAEINLE